MIRLRYALFASLITLAACKCSRPEPVPPPSLVEIVASLFDDLLDETAEGIKPAVRTFLDQTKDTTSKADLAQAWNAVAVLAGQFKLEHIYKTAREDGSWKTEAEKKENKR